MRTVGYEKVIVTSIKSPVEVVSAVLLDVGHVAAPLLTSLVLCYGYAAGCTAHLCISALRGTAGDAPAHDSRGRGSSSSKQLPQ